MGEYKDKCDNCNKEGNSTFARIYHKRIDEVWKYLCPNCWDEVGSDF